MELSAIRSLARRTFGALGRTSLTVLGMAAIVLGLLAMHSVAAESTSSAGLSVAPTSAAYASQAAAPAATTPVLVTAATAAVPFDETCSEGAMDCALMVTACAMLLTVIAFVLFACRPSLFRKLMDAGTRAVAAMPRPPLQVLRPNLHVLSISRS